MEHFTNILRDSGVDSRSSVVVVLRVPRPSFIHAGVRIDVVHSYLKEVQNVRPANEDGHLCDAVSRTS
jgi:hypothetical protein